MKRKRYWAASLLAAFIVLTIGIYYIQAASSRLPQFRLAAVEGNEAEAERLALEAYYSHDAYGEQADITAAGTRYESERPFVDRVRELKGWMGSVQPIARLTRQHPDFMRGRTFAEYQEDDAWVIRAELRPGFGIVPLKPIYQFQIDILDKTTDKSRSFQVDIPETKFDGRSIIDVQRIGNTLKAAVQYDNIGKNGRRDETEIRIYDIDLNEERISGSAKVDYGAAARDGQEIRIGRISEYDWTKPSDMLTLEVSILDNTGTEEITNGSSVEIDGKNVQAAVQRFKMTEHRLVVYHYETGELKRTSLPNDLPDVNLNLWRVGPFVLRTGHDGKTLDLKSYRTADATLAFEKKLTAQSLGAETINGSAIGPDRLYLTLTSSGTPGVAAIDPADGHVAYRGTVTIDGVQEDRKKGMLSRIGIHSITVQS